MAFTLTDQHRREWQRDGVTILRGLLPPALVDRLRTTAATARQLARAQHGPQAQRLQPVDRPELDRDALQAYVDLPALTAAVQALCGPGVSGSSGLGTLGILVEPAERAWCTDWHRDWAHHGVDRQIWAAVRADPLFFNQTNTALYADDSLWVVPGSHARDEETPAELAAKAAMPALDGLAPTAAERAIHAYAEGMPGAVRVHLEPGDCALYRNSIWHLGTYRPYQVRATLHDAPYAPAYRRWADERRLEMAQRREAAART